MWANQCADGGFVNLSEEQVDVWMNERNKLNHYALSRVTL